MTLSERILLKSAFKKTLRNRAGRFIYTVRPDQKDLG